MKTRLDAFEIKGLRKILRVLWTAKKTNEWLLNCQSKEVSNLAYYGHTLRKQGVVWRKTERDNARNNARCTQAR